MQITKCTFSKPYISWGEPFDLSYTIQMGSDETLQASNSSGGVSYFFNDVRNPSAGIYFSSAEIGTEPDTGFEGISLGAGKTKTFSIKNLVIRKEEGLEDLFLENSGDSGEARRYPLTLAVRAVKQDGNETVAYYPEAANFLLSRVAPTIGAPIEMDKKIVTFPAEINGNQVMLSVQARERFGGYVQGQSVPQLIFPTAGDGLDLSLKITGTLTVTYPSGMIKTYSKTVGLVLDEASGEVFLSDSFTFLPEIAAEAGEYAYSYTVIDSEGNKGVHEDIDGNISDAFTGTLKVVPYHLPRIDRFKVTRYTPGIDDSGNTTYNPAEDGQYVYLDFAGAIGMIGKRNNWSLTITYGPDGGEMQEKLLYSEEVAREISIEQDHSTITDIFSILERYSFTATLTDLFGNTAQTVFIEESGADFEISPYGVGDGGRCTGTPEAPHSDFFRPTTFHDEVEFKGGAKGLNNYVSKATPTGGTWIDGKPIYRRVVTGSVTAGTQKSIAYAGSGVVDQVVRLDGLYQVSWGWLPFTYFTSSSNQLRIYASKTNVVFNSNNLDGTVRVIIEYTKVAD